LIRAKTEETTTDTDKVTTLPNKNLLKIMQKHENERIKWPGNQSKQVIRKTGNRHDSITANC